MAVTLFDSQRGRAATKRKKNNWLAEVEQVTEKPKGEIPKIKQQITNKFQ